MSRYIEADALKGKFINADVCGIGMVIDRYALKCIDEAPTVRTKTVKYFDEDEQAWTVGEVIVRGENDDSK